MRYPRAYLSLKVLLCCFCFAVGTKAYSQDLPTEEEAQVVRRGIRYLDLNIHALDKYSDRVERQQKLLLRKLKRKEAHFAKQLKQKDSAVYIRYQANPLSYDSISHLLNPDSATLTAKTKHKANKIIDSLKGVQSFIGDNAAKAGINSPELNKYSGELGSLQQKLDYNEYINGLIAQHTNSLKGLGTKTNIPALGDIEKELFYGKSKIAAWKQVAEEPSKLEEKALEYLQGTKGFDQALNKATLDRNGIQAGMTADELERLGFQTKASLSRGLQEKFGDNIGNIQQQVIGQVNEWQDKIQTPLSEYKQGAQQIKTGIQQIKAVPKPSLKINPVRGLPFWHRIEKGYNFQTSRASSGGKPAMLQVAGTAGLKWSPKLITGLGIATNIGLGKNWSNIHLSFEGIGFRTFLEWKWIYGIGLYGGYEKSFKQFEFLKKNENFNKELSQSTHGNSVWNESALLGLSKTYKINSKWNGAIQVLYDLWWRDKKSASPFVIRFVNTMTK